MGGSSPPFLVAFALAVPELAGSDFRFPITGLAGHWKAIKLMIIPTRFKDTPVCDEISIHKMQGSGSSPSL